MILSVYSLLAACTQLLWLSFAAIDTDTAKVLHTDVGTVGDLAAIFPFVYVVLALPVGRLAGHALLRTRWRSVRSSPVAVRCCASSLRHRSRSSSPDSS